MIGMDAVQNAESQYRNVYRLKEKYKEKGVVNPLVDYFTSIVGKGMLPKIRGLCKSKESTKVDTLVLD